MIPERVPNTAVISVIDLELDDAIHVGTQGQKRVGHRLARIAQRELFGQVGATTPTLRPGRQRTSQHAAREVQRGEHGLARPEPRQPMMGRMGVMSGPGGMAATMNPSTSFSLGEPAGIGLEPDRHIAGFSIHKEDGTEVPLIFEAGVGKARDTVVLKLAGRIPPKSALWYGYGMDPYCNLTDGMDMAVPVFGPDPARRHRRLRAAMPVAAASARPQGQNSSDQGSHGRPIQALIITGDNVGAHQWRETSQGAEGDPRKGRPDQG